ncbi:MAG: hypothetical protein GQ583_02075 [Methyloprofundus sp.]|nr:hypothetical protein [Methyloprofundus sp.]
MKNKIPQNQQSFYVKRIETFLRFLHNSDLKNHSGSDISNPSNIKAENVSNFLLEIDRKTEMSSWQFRQVIHALKLFLISLCHLPWAKDFDWNYWQDAAIKLADKHTTVAGITGGRRALNVSYKGSTNIASFDDKKFARRAKIKKLPPPTQQTHHHSLWQ